MQENADLRALLRSMQVKEMQYFKFYSLLLYVIMLHIAVLFYCAFMLHIALFRILQVFYWLPGRQLSVYGFYFCTKPLISLFDRPRNHSNISWHQCICNHKISNSVLIQMNVLCQMDMREFLNAPNGSSQPTVAANGRQESGSPHSPLGGKTV